MSQGRFYPVENIPTPYHFQQGDSPLLVSMPHCGTELLPNMKDSLTPQAQALPDTDWYIPELYDFLGSLNVSTLSARYSRYVVDLNRPSDDKPLYHTKTTGLFPDILFSDQPIFLTGHEFDSATKAFITEHIWQPYHQKVASELQRIQQQFGYAILFDAHSIAAQVPMLFTGTLPDFNLGNNSGKSCAPAMLQTIAALAEQSPYTTVTNGRFTGGYITRHFGQPHHNIHAVQLELSQATYLRDDCTSYQLDPEKLAQVRTVLKPMIESLLNMGNPADLRSNKDNKGE